MTTRRRTTPIPLTHALAMAMLAGEWREQDMVERCGIAVGARPRWIEPLVRAVLHRFEHAPRDAEETLARAIDELEVAERARWRDETNGEGVRGARWAGDRREDDALPLVRRWLIDEPRMGSSVGEVPSLASTGELAAWLGLPPTMLDFFADVRGLGARIGITKLLHYTVRFLPKPRGQGVRVLEAPKSRLKAIQRRILREILDRVPAHDAAHGFVRGRSIASHAALHASRAVVIRLDLEDFFPSVYASRVHAIFRALGYPISVARTLTGLTTTVTPRSAWRGLDASSDPDELARRFHQRQRYAARHLPQGAPTSPTLANLAAYGLDVRLSAFAQEAGATYSRYADDLAFSGGEDLARSASRFIARASAIATEEGLVVQHRKTRVMRVSQRQELCGLVVNHTPRPRRDELKRLEATLFNCARDGADAHNRAAHEDFRAHLAGRIAWVAAHDAKRGARLREIFDAVAW